MQELCLLKSLYFSKTYDIVAKNNYGERGEVEQKMYRELWITFCYSSPLQVVK